MGDFGWLSQEGWGAALVLLAAVVTMYWVPQVEDRHRYPWTPGYEEIYGGRFLNGLIQEGQDAAQLLLTAGATENQVPWVKTRPK